MTEIPTDEQRFIPLSDYTMLEEKLASLEEERTKIIDERNQLSDALKQLNSGIHRASEEKGEMVLTVETWRRGREMGMNLLGIPMGHDDAEVIISWNGGKLEDIRQKK